MALEKKCQNLIFVAKNHVDKHCDDICNDIILMPQFHEVVRQHILGVVGNINKQFFLANLIDLPAVKDLTKL